MEHNKYIGSSIESFLKQEGILEEVTTQAIQVILEDNQEETDSIPSA